MRAAEDLRQYPTIIQNKILRDHNGDERTNIIFQAIYSARKLVLLSPNANINVSIGQVLQAEIPEKATGRPEPLLISMRGCSPYFCGVFRVMFFF